MSVWLQKHKRLQQFSEVSAAEIAEGVRKNPKTDSIIFWDKLQ
jgi:hypothetical protein